MKTHIIRFMTGYNEAILFCGLRMVGMELNEHTKDTGLTDESANYCRRCLAGQKRQQMKEEKAMAQK